jgi:hypothetical protein
MNIGLFLEAQNPNIIFYWYTGSSFDPEKFQDWIELKKVAFENNVWVSDINSSYSWALIYFSAIKWIPKIYLKTTSHLEENTWSWVIIKIWYKWSKTGLLSKELQYYKNTFVIDYK